MLAERGCAQLFPPPYSFEFTSIEQAFSKRKAFLRSLGARTQEALQEAVRNAVAASTSAGAPARLARAGQPLPPQ